MCLTAVVRRRLVSPNGKNDWLELLHQEMEDFCASSILTCPDKLMRFNTTHWQEVACALSLADTLLVHLSLSAYIAAYIVYYSNSKSLLYCIINFSLLHRGWRESQRWWRQQRIRRRRAKSEPGAQSAAQPLDRWQSTGQYCPQTQRCSTHNPSY